MTLENETKIGKKDARPGLISVTPPVFEMTEGMRYAEAQLPEGQSLYGLMSGLCARGFSRRAIAGALNVRTETASKWLQIAKLEVAPNAGKRPYSRRKMSVEEISDTYAERWKDEGFKKRHRDGCLRGWSEDKKAARLALMHTPESEELRSKSRKKWIEDHPDEAAEQYRKSAETRRKKAAEAGMQTGGKAKKLTTLSWKAIRERESLVELASEANLFGYLPSRNYQIMIALYSWGRHSIVLEEVAAEYGVTRERVRQIEEKSLMILEQMLLGELIPRNGVAGVSAKRTRRSNSAFLNELLNMPL